MRADKSEKRRKRLVIIMGVIIILSMIASIFAVYVDQYTSTTIKYGKRDFTMTTEGYQTKINKTIITFSYLPQEVERYNVSPTIGPTLKNAQFIVILIDPSLDKADLEYVDAARYLYANQVPTPVYVGQLMPSDTYSALPILSCDNATVQTPFIVFTAANITGTTIVEEAPGCIIVQSRLREFIAAKDRLVYSYYGIMP